MPGGLLGLQVCEGVRPRHTSGPGCVYRRKALPQAMSANCSPQGQGCKKARRKTCRAFLFFRFEPNAAYSATGAPTGQTPAQAPHSMQVSALISYLPLPSEIADTGHSASQAPQLMQASLIAYAMFTHLLARLTDLGRCTHCIPFLSILQVKNMQTYSSV